MARVTLKELFQRKYFGELEWDPNAKCHDNYDYYVTDNPDEIRFHKSTYEDGSEMLTVKAASKFEDGFGSEIAAIRIGKFFVAVVKRGNARHNKWLLKMSNHGWEKIPRKYYSRTVDLEEIGL